MERAVVPRHGAARREIPRRAAGAGRRPRWKGREAADREADARDHPSRPRGAGVRARAGRGAPRSEAREHHDHPGRPPLAREHQAPRLRDREARGSFRAGLAEAHAARHGAGNARVHGARAGGGSGGRRPQRRLLVRDHPLPAAHGSPAVRRRREHRCPADAHQHAAQVPARGRGRRLDSRRRGACRLARAGKAARATLSVRRPASAGARASRGGRLWPHGRGRNGARPGADVGRFALPLPCDHRGGRDDAAGGSPAVAASVGREQRRRRRRHRARAPRRRREAGRARDRTTVTRAGQGQASQREARSLDVEARRRAQPLQRVCD